MNSTSNFAVQHGQLNTARQVASPNYNQRPDDQAICAIVIHNISLPPSQFGGGFIEQFFQNQLNPDDHPYFSSISQLQVSAHLLILRDGEIIQFVNFNDRAWHAGRSSYWGMQECNDFSIGIELEGCDEQAFTAEQYTALSQSILAIEQAYPMTKQHLTGHSDIAPQRKTDPGPYFDWQQLRQLIQKQRK